MFHSISRSEVIAIVRLTENTAINVAKLQEQLAKNVTVYTTGTNSGGVSNTNNNFGAGSNTNSDKSDKTSTAIDSGDSVSKLWFLLKLIIN